MPTEEGQHPQENLAFQWLGLLCGDILGYLLENKLIILWFISYYIIYNYIIIYYILGHLLARSPK